MWVKGDPGARKTGKQKRDNAFQMPSAVHPAGCLGIKLSREQCNDPVCRVAVP